MEANFFMIMVIIVMITTISIIMIVSILMIMNMIMVMMSPSQEITSAIFDSIGVKSHM